MDRGQRSYPLPFFFHLIPLSPFLFSHSTSAFQHHTLLQYLYAQFQRHRRSFVFISPSYSFFGLMHVCFLCVYCFAVILWVSSVHYLDLDSCTVAILSILLSSPHYMDATLLRTPSPLVLPTYYFVVRSALYFILTIHCIAFSVSFPIHLKCNRIGCSSTFLTVQAKIYRSTARSTGRWNVP